MSSVYITSTPTGEADVQFAYDATLVDLLKATVPASRRRWDTTSKRWTLSAPYDIPPFVARARAAGHTVTIETPHGRASTPPPSGPRAPAARWADDLLDAVGPARADAVFRALTRVLHPDLATGDTVLMQALNAARTRRAA